MKKTFMFFIVFAVLISSGVFNIQSDAFTIYWSLDEMCYDEYINNSKITEDFVYYDTIKGFGEFRNCFTYSLRSQKEYTYFLDIQGQKHNLIIKRKELVDSEKYINYYSLSKDEINSEDMRTCELPKNIKCASYIEPDIEYYYKDYGKLYRIIWYCNDWAFDIEWYDSIYTDSLLQNECLSRIINLEEARELVNELKIKMDEKQAAVIGESIYMTAAEYDEFVKGDTVTDDFVLYETLLQADEINCLGKLEGVYIDSQEKWSHIRYDFLQGYDYHSINIRKNKNENHDFKELPKERVDLQYMSRCSDDSDQPGKYVDGNVQYIYCSNSQLASIVWYAGDLEFSVFTNHDFEIMELMNVENTKKFADNLDKMLREEDDNLTSPKDIVIPKEKTPTTDICYVIGVASLLVIVTLGILAIIFINKRRKSR